MFFEKMKFVICSVIIVTCACMMGATLIFSIFCLAIAIVLYGLATGIRAVFKELTAKTRRAYIIPVKRCRKCGCASLSKYIVPEEDELGVAIAWCAIYSCNRCFHEHLAKKKYVRRQTNNAR